MKPKSNRVPIGPDKKPIDRNFPATEPIFWGPEQDTAYPDVYNLPKNWRENELLAIPRVVRLVYGGAAAPPPPLPPPPVDWCTNNTGDSIFVLVARRLFRAGFGGQAPLATGPSNTYGSYSACGSSGFGTALIDMRETTIMDSGPWETSTPGEELTTEDILFYTRPEEHRKFQWQSLLGRPRAVFGPTQTLGITCDSPLFGQVVPYDSPTFIPGEGTNLPRCDAALVLGPGFIPPASPGDLYFGYDSDAPEFNTIFYYYSCRGSTSDWPGAPPTFAGAGHNIFGVIQAGTSTTPNSEPP